MGSYHIADIDLKKGECHDRTKDSPPQMEQRDNQPHGILVNRNGRAGVGAGRYSGQPIRVSEDGTTVSGILFTMPRLAL